MKQRTSGGFTLIELMVVVLILSILATVAISAYGAYSDQAWESKIQSAHKQGVRYAVTQMTAQSARLASGSISADELPDSDTWIHLLNGDSELGTNMAGGLIYQSAASDVEGTVGVQSSGADIGTYAVTLVQPASLTLETCSSTVHLNGTVSAVGAGC